MLINFAIMYGALLFLLVITFSCINQKSFAQIGIGTTAPDASTILHLHATDKGFLVPRMTQAQRTAISSPATGLLVYQTDGTSGFYYYNGSSWEKITTGSGGDNLGNHTATQNIKLNGNWLSGDADNEGVFVTNNGNVGIGTNSPSATLHVEGSARITGLWNGLVRSDASGNLSHLAYTTASDVLRGDGTFGTIPIGNAAWNTSGNSGLTAGTHFIGTTDNVPLDIRVNNTKSGRIGLSGDGSTFFGFEAGLNDDLTDNQNTFIGFRAGKSTTNGISNTASGYQALLLNTTGSYNTAHGSSALYSNTTGDNNTAHGSSALYSNTTGNKNTAIGVNSLYANQNGYNNTAIGESALFSNISGYDNTAIGSNSLFSNTTGTNNIATGALSMYNNTLGANNVAYGANSLHGNTTASRNVAIGNNALLTQSYNNGGTTWNSDNVAIGYEAMYYNEPTSTTNGRQNTAVGTFSMRFNTTGAYNSAVGYEALRSNQVGSNNTAMGFGALYNTNASNNTAFGYNALVTNTNGTNNTAIGYGADVTSGTLTNATAIGYNAKVGASNSLVLGGTGADAVNVGIGTTTPSQRLHVSGGSILTDRAYAASTANIPANTSAFNTGTNPVTQVRITDNMNPSANGNLTYGATPVEGQYLWITNNDAQSVDFASTTPVTTIPSGATYGFVYVGGAWRVVQAPSASSSGWALTGNSGTIDGTHFIGTTDNVPFNIRVNNQKSGRIGLSGDGSTFFGYQAGLNNNNSIDNRNTFIGFQAGMSNTNGTYNTAIGYMALQAGASSTYNTAIGVSALEQSIGSYNVAIGTSACKNNTDGQYNIANGPFALFNNTKGNSNIALGYSSMYSNFTASRNIAIGYKALASQSYSNSGTVWNSDNVAIGYQALYSNNASSSTSQGIQNTAVGNDALYQNTTGSKNVAIGYAAGPNTGNLNNTIAIGANAVVSSNNSAIIGGTGADAVNVGISVTEPHAKLHLSRSNPTDPDLLFHNANNLNNSGELMTRIDFRDNHTTTLGQSQAYIRVFRDAASSGSSDLPTSVEFGVTPDGSSTPNTAMVIKNNGFVGLNTLTPNARFHLNGSMSIKVVNTNTNYTVSNDDYMIIANADCTITLPTPSAAGQGKVYLIKKGTGNFSVTIDGGLTDEFDEGALSSNIDNYSLNSGVGKQSVMMVSDGNEWHVIK